MSELGAAQRSWKWNSSKSNHVKLAPMILKSILGVRSLTPSRSVLRECGIELFQFNWFRAMRLYNSLIHCNSPLHQKVYIMLMVFNTRYVSQTSGFEPACDGPQISTFCLLEAISLSSSRLSSDNSHIIT
eukprot:scaffold194381_cov17-Tisochrysis_lutea.AAC.1